MVGEGQKLWHGHGGELKRTPIGKEVMSVKTPDKGP